MAGKLEAGPERVERLQHFQPFLGALGDHLVLRCRKVGIRTKFRPAHTPAQLIELGEPEHVCPVDDKRVRARDVEAAFDNRGREQHIIFALIEGGHDVFELARRHLSVGDDEGDFRHMRAEEILQLVEIGDARRHEKGLPATILFAQQRLAQCDGIFLGDVGAHRQAVDRRCRNDRQIADAGQRHLQRARDRGR